jgi:Ser/Thr protein kinase RdoA (MazF antagonist)
MALATAAALLRRIVSARYVAPSWATWSDEMADPDAGIAPAVDLVICHNDACLENLVYRDQVAVGLLDFDFAAPGRRVHTSPPSPG